MAIERKLSVGLDDIAAVTFECGQCHVKTTFPAHAIQTPPHRCSSCQFIWWASHEMSTNTSTSAPARLAFILALQKLRAAQTTDENAPPTFRIILEFEDPSTTTGS
jgi:hypothetical protein